jgi:23S rRNA A2030 N6-methylase RlmJ
MGGMANRHFGKIADVWKHAALMEAVGQMAPGRYAETHAGSAAYPMVRDSERAFGILRFLDVAPQHPALAGSRYLAAVAPYVRPGQAGRGRGATETYPGSALLAMTALGDDCCYLFCDLDPHSAADLRHRAAGLGLHDWKVAEADGMLTVRAWLDGTGSQGPGPARGTAIVHIDPFDPHARAPGGLSAVEFAGHLATTGTGLVYWYGCDEPGEHAWAYRQLCDLTPAPLWCGDIMVTDTGGGSPGDLGLATTPGTGFGVVLANLAPDVLTACTAVGRALADAYTGVTLPGGTRGSLVFTSYRRP